MGIETIIGLAGMVLVFTSFLIKRWIWLYTFNMIGTSLLAVYAYLQRDLVFLVVEVGLVFFLAYRFLAEVRSSNKLKT